MKLYLDQQDDGLLIITADGEINTESADQFVGKVDQFIAKGATRIIIDCTLVDFMSSSGIFQVIRLHKHARKQGGDVKLCSIKGLVRDVLHIMRMDKVFEIYPDLASARAAMSGNP